MSATAKGTIYSIIAAVSYGMNPLGALFLYQEGLNTNSVLFYRFSIAAIILGAIMSVQKQTFSISKREFLVLSALGILFGISSLSLFSSFHYMDAGVASTLLFVYPVMVAVLMTVLFKERMSTITILSISLALAGIGLLYKSDGGTTLSTLGVILVMISSLSYAIYIIVVNKASLAMSSMKLTFYVLIFCTLTIFLDSLTSTNSHLQTLPSLSAWTWALMLSLIPTIISLITMVKAVQAIGSTPTAIMGALEPLTAVIIGVAVFGEIFTLHLAIGILMILSAVVLIVIGKSLKPKAISATVHKAFTLKKKV